MGWCPRGLGLEWEKDTQERVHGKARRVALAMLMSLYIPGASVGMDGVWRGVCQGLLW